MSSEMYPQPRYRRGKIINVYIDTNGLDDVTPETQFSAEPMMLELLALLVREHPTWSFVSSPTIQYPMSDPKRYACRKFEVKVGTEDIGTIASTSRNNGEKIVALQSPDIRSSTNRGGPMETKDIKKAQKLIKKHFFPKSIAHHLKESVEKSNGFFTRRYTQSKFAYERTLSNISHTTLEYILERPALLEEVAAVTGERGKWAEIESARPKYIEADIANTMNEHGLIFNVLELRNGEFHVFNNKDWSDPIKFNRETLPPWFGSCMGILKAVDPHKFISGIGIRHSDVLFSILPEEKEPEPTDG